MGLPFKPNFFVRLAFFTPTPSFAPFMALPDRKKPFDRRTHLSTLSYRKNPKKGTDKVIKEWQASLENFYGDWAKESTWASWDNLFRICRTEPRLSKHVRSLCHLQRLTRLVESFHPNGGKNVAVSADEFLTNWRDFLTRPEPAFKLIDKARMSTFLDGQAAFECRCQALNKIYQEIDFPMMLLGCLTSCLQSKSWRKASVFKNALPLEAGLRALSRNPKRGDLWNRWLRWAQREFGAKNQRKWAVALAEMGDPTSKAVVINRMLNNRGDVSYKSICSLREGFEKSKKIKGKQLWITQVEWHFYALLIFNLELCLHQYIQTYQLSDKGIRSAFYAALRWKKHFDGDS